MSHNPPDISGNSIPTGAAQPPSISAPVGATSEGKPVGQTEGALSEVSDIVGLTEEQARTYSAFDPAVHATNPDGTPKLRKGGTGYQLRRGRKPGAAAAPAKPSSTITIAGQDAPAATMTNAQAALMLTGLTTAGFQMLLGPDWEVQTSAEKSALVDSMRAYLDATGGMDMSPSTALVISWGGYALPRLGKDETQSRLQRFGGWLKSVFTRNRG